MTAPRTTTAVTGWIGRRPPEGGECNRPSGICGDIDCADESRCLERPHMKLSQPVASSPATAYLAPVRTQ